MLNRIKPISLSDRIRPVYSRGKPRITKPLPDRYIYDHPQVIIPVDRFDPVIKRRPPVLPIRRTVRRIVNTQTKLPKRGITTIKLDRNNIFIKQPPIKSSHTDSARRLRLAKAKAKARIRKIKLLAI